MEAASGSKTLNPLQVTEPLKAIQLPEKLDIIHQPAQTSSRRKGEIRNSQTDITTKVTAQVIPNTKHQPRWSDLVLLAPFKDTFDCSS